MLKHFFRITIQGFKKHKTSLLINLTGLSTGLACVLLIFIWVTDELSVDKFHEKDDQLYVAMVNTEHADGIWTSSGAPPLLGPALSSEYPEIEDAAFVNSFDTPGLLEYNNQNRSATALFASKNVFEILSYPLIQGEPASALADKRNIVLSQELATSLFGSVQDAIGQSVLWSNDAFDVEGSFIVSGVFASIPTNATRQFDVVVDFQLMADGDENAALWPSGYAENFLILKQGTDVQQLNTKITSFLKDKHPSRSNATLFVQQFSERYLHGNYENGVLTGGRIEYVRLFSVLAFFILLIACVNFMNLSTARASTKTKEIGVKKSLGADRSSLIYQFLGESILMAALSLVIALGIVHVFLPEFNALTGKQLQLVLSAKSFGLLSGFVLLTGLIAGSYPALYLSGFSVQSIFKNNLPHAPGKGIVRKGLVVFQFTIAITFIVGILVLNAQVNYALEKNLGYDRENIVSFSRGPLASEADHTALRAQLQTIPGVVAFGNMSGTIQWGMDNQSGYSWRGVESDKKVSFKSPRVGYNLIETLDMEIIAGRSFSPEFGPDTSSIMINESALALMGLQEPVGQWIKYGDEERRIIGVVQDFNYGSIHEEIAPMILRFREFGSNFVLRVQPGTEQAVLAQTEAIFKSLFPAYDFTYSFMDDAYQALYEAESRVASFSNFFGVLAVLIACLGLFGLASFIAERRIKEIGIRKILGASVLGIVNLLSQDFLKLVLIAICIAMPISYLIVTSWLDGFAYHIELHAWYFIGAAVITALIAWITISVQTIKAAIVNPVASLQHD